VARIVAAMAATHSPGLAGWFDSASEDYQQRAIDAFGRMRQALEQAQPDVLLIFSNDHLLNWPLNNTPEYTVGTGATHTGPAEWYAPWLNLDRYTLQGNPGLARFMVNEAARRGLHLASLRQMEFDDGFSVPLHYLNPDMTIPMVPVSMNCTVPPIPSPERAYDVGRTMREIVLAYPGGERVAVIGSGGLSHEPGGPRYFFIDEEFDRWFLEGLADGNHERLLRECTLERMEEAGSGGTAELIAWFVALAFTSGPADVLDYMAAHAWRSGTGMVIWPTLAA